MNSVERVQSHGMVLVADDDPNFSANMVEVLKDKGYRVQVARTGKQALDTVLGGGIDILVLDLQLPVVSGLEVYMELQKRGRALPTVCVTGYSQDQAEAIDQLSSLSAGILTKPFNTNQLLEVLGNIVPPGGASAAPDAPVVVRAAAGHLPVRGLRRSRRRRTGPGRHRRHPHRYPGATRRRLRRVTTEYGHGSSSQAASGRGRIIAVDDDVDMVDGLAEVLEAHGYEVKTANDQDAAIKTIQEYDAQVALLDIRLGNSNGLDLISRLKEYRPNLYCIVITGNADKESAVTALRNGAYDYMTKPLHPNELFSVIERCLDKHRLEQRADAAFDALQIAKDAAENASMSKSQFFATMSRELRKPITAIMNSSNALIEEAHGALGAPQYMPSTPATSATAAAICWASSAMPWTWPRRSRGGWRSTSRGRHQRAGLHRRARRPADPSRRAPQDPARPAGSGADRLGRSASAEADRHEPAVERGEVHRR